MHLGLHRKIPLHSARCLLQLTIAAIGLKSGP